MEILIIIIAIILIIILWKFYSIKYDTVIAFTGGLGSGKSFLSVSMAKKLLRKNRNKVKWHNRFEHLKKFFNRKRTLNIWEKPMLYTSIPVRISKKEWSIKLTYNQLLMVDRIVPRSVTFIDEVGSWASQFEYNNKNILETFDEFVRLYRHYTLGGYLVINDQCSENIVLQIRRRVNTVNNLMCFKVWFKLFYTVKVRHISISEEIKTIEETNTEDNMSTLFGLMPLFRKSYDTYCYSPRYDTVTLYDNNVYDQYKKLTLLKVPKYKIKSNIYKEPKTDTITHSNPTSIDLTALQALTDNEPLPPQDNNNAI